LSIVPLEVLESADSLNLITFGVPLDILALINTIDIWTRYQAFWKSAVVRNTHPGDTIQVRTGPDGDLTDVLPNTQVPILGWGSFLQVISPAATPHGVVDFTCVTLKNAVRKSA